jgi:hypothetical protein
LHIPNPRLSAGDFIIQSKQGPLPESKPINIQIALIIFFPILWGHYSQYLADLLDKTSFSGTISPG